LEIVERFAAFDRDIGTALTDADGKPLRAQHLNRNGTANLFVIAPYASVADEFRALLRKRKEVHTFDTIEELRRALLEFAHHYNETWLVARHRHRTPAQVRADQRRVDRPSLAELPWAA